ncbi:TRAP transporter small permease [Aliamphritea hakodatensis]|uniref:TRAP transporter small permease n=1 Tax=Aliamphritea hakodatensis TaxID=2895352 RepID=UPI0022FD9A93|nr:TRAP transporter small permease [Aliamphritea hakodatensis]
MVYFLWLLQTLERFNRPLALAGWYISALFIALMMIMVIIQVFFRYVLNSSLSWAEDLSLMLMVWMAFLAVPVAYRKALHVQMDLAQRLIPARLNHLLQFLISTAICVLLVYLISKSFSWAWHSTIRANAVPVQMKYIYAVIPLTLAVLLPNCFENSLRSLLCLIKPDITESIQMKDAGKMTGESN